MKTIRTVGWIILGISPVLLWYEIYQASITTYDENWWHLLLAALVALLVMSLLIFNRKGLESFPLLKKFLRVFALAFASPLTLGLLFLYQLTFAMQWKWSGSFIDEGERVTDIKKRNYFKAENYLIFEDLRTKPDTIMSIVTKAGEIKRIVRFKKGEEIELSNTMLDSLTSRQRQILSEY